MLSWLARKLKHRLSPADRVASLTIEQLAAAIGTHKDFTGFLAWRAQAGEAEEQWQWSSQGLPDQELLYQLEKAAVSVTTRMRTQENLVQQISALFSPGQRPA